MKNRIEFSGYIIKSPKNNMFYIIGVQGYFLLLGHKNFYRDFEASLNELVIPNHFCTVIGETVNFQGKSAIAVKNIICKSEMFIEDDNFFLKLDWHLNRGTYLHNPFSIEIFEQDNLYTVTIKDVLRDSQYVDLPQDYCEFFKHDNVYVMGFNDLIKFLDKLSLDDFYWRKE